jgi:solute:Na+ symporter, SSS family
LAQALVAAAVGALRPLAGRRTRSGTFRDAARAQVASLVIIAAAAVLAAAPAADLVGWSEVALACAALIALPLAAICWFPTVTGAALAIGLALGAAIIVVLPNLAHAPTLQSVLPAFAAAAAMAIVVSVLRPRDSQRQRRLDAVRQIDTALAVSGEERVRTPILVLAALAWIFFAIGPGAVVGNDLFGAPDADHASWSFVLPSIAVWQILSWASGVALVWFVSRNRAAVGREEAQRLTALGPKASPQMDLQSADRSGMPDR